MFFRKKKNIKGALPVTKTLPKIGKNFKIHKIQTKLSFAGHNNATQQHHRERCGSVRKPTYVLLNADYTT